MYLAFQNLYTDVDKYTQTTDPDGIGHMDIVTQTSDQGSKNNKAQEGMCM